MFTPLEYHDGVLRLIDQRILPRKENWIEYKNLELTAQAIEEMVVRGAPAIGCAAAYALVLDARDTESCNWEGYQKQFNRSLERLSKTRPTAVNLFYALSKAEELSKTFSSSDDIGFVVKELENLAEDIFKDDLKTCKDIGRFGAGLAEGTKKRILTHCNAGALATAGYGTALGVVRALHEEGLLEHVYVDETRPWMQGSRLTAYELDKEGISHSLNIDSAAAVLMSQGLVDWVVVGADRIARNGDVANKIGTYSLAVNAKYHGVKFYVAAPFSTFDFSTADGSGIKIEQRAPQEVTDLMGQRVAPEGTQVLNPAFDVTSSALIDGIITEKGILYQPFVDKIGKLMKE